MSLVKKIEERMEKEIDRDITPIEALGKLPDIEVLDSDYMMSQNQYNFQIQKSRIDQDQFMSELLQYIEFHEKALNLYNSETNEMYIQTAAEITKQHYKEIEIKQKELSDFEKQRQEFEKIEQIKREHLKELRDALSLAMSMKHTQLAESIQKELKEGELKMKIIDDTIENLEEKEKFVRSFLENEGENFYCNIDIIKNLEKYY